MAGTHLLLSLSLSQVATLEDKPVLQKTHHDHVGGTGTKATDGWRIETRSALRPRQTAYRFDASSQWASLTAFADFEFAQSGPASTFPGEQTAPSDLS